MEHKPYYGSGSRGNARGASGRANGSGRTTAPRAGNTPPSRARSYAQAPRARGYDAASVRRDAPAQRRMPPPVKRRKNDPLARIIPLLLVAAALFGIYYVGSAWLVSQLNRSTYCDNIYINGIELTAYDREKGAQHVNEIIAERLSSPHILTLGERSWSFSAADFNGSIRTDMLLNRAWNPGHFGSIFDRKKSIDALKDNPIYMEAPLEYDKDRIDGFIERLYNEVYLAPVDATVLGDLDKPYLMSESTRGQELDRETLREQIISLLETGEGSTELPILLIDPDLSTEAALSTLELIVEYKTDVSIRLQDSRFNVRKALGYFNIEVHPGETIDFNAVVGPRSEVRGWKSATEYIGNTTTEGFGGGVCQASTTLYGAMMLSGMTIIERQPHSMTVTYVEPSIDAAVTDTGKNLIFRNNTDSSIFIRTDVDKEFATVRVYGKRPAYRYELRSELVSQSNSAIHKSYIADKEGKFCYYTTDTKLYKKGHTACSSNGWLYAYDWETGQEVSRTKISFDIYESGTDIYWRGIHPPLDQTTTSFAPNADLNDAAGNA